MSNEPVKIKASNIKDYIEVCPYCMDEYDGGYPGCCGEVHSEEAVVTKDGECYRLSEVEIDENI